MVADGIVTADGVHRRCDTIILGTGFRIFAVPVMDREGIQSLDVRPDVQHRYTADIPARLAGTVWVDGGCKSWYLDAQGVNRTLWPTFSNAFKRRLREFDLADFETAPAASVPDTDGTPRTHDDKEYV